MNGEPMLDILEFCEALEKYSLENGFDVTVRPTHWPQHQYGPRWPRYDWELSCGHSLRLGVPSLNRHPHGQAWCDECQEYRSGVVRTEVANGL